MITTREFTETAACSEAASRCMDKILAANLAGRARAYVCAWHRVLLGQLFAGEVSPAGFEAEMTATIELARGL